MDLTRALDLLKRESEALDAVVGSLSETDWRRPTPAVGWTVAHQIGHLHWADTVAEMAVTGSPEFRKVLDEASDSLTDDTAAEHAARPQQELLSDWRRQRGRLHEALADADPQKKIPWFGPPMRLLSMVTARIMETWAHGLDIHDGLSREKVPSESLEAVARIGYRTRGFSYANRRLVPPDDDVRVVLTMPDGTQLEYGDPEAKQSVTGTADAFCRVVTQRRHPSEVEISAEGQHALEWLSIAQAFAGPPTEGPRAEIPSAQSRASSTTENPTLGQVAR